MNAQPTTGKATTEQQSTELADPTRSIIRCCELRKRKAAETQLLTIRLRTQAGSTTQH